MKKETILIWTPIIGWFYGTYLVFKELRLPLDGSWNHFLNGVYQGVCIWLVIYLLIL